MWEIRPSPLYYFKHEKVSKVGCVALTTSNRVGDLLGKGGVLREEIPGQRFPRAIYSCDLVPIYYLST